MGVIFLFYCLCLIVSLSHTTPTSFLEKQTLPSTWVHAKEKLLLQLEKRDTPTRPHPDHQFLSARRPLQSRQLESGSQVNNGTNQTMWEIALINSLNTGTGAGVNYATEKLFKVSPSVSPTFRALNCGGLPC
ncbi:hypothetical protein PSTG_17186 [Puccinia striiformis f. sp. tritici PST-78]|uniref:Uncharacterized protein n=1 Tax=Puccinia striiformis f. sp. tritici PST-78 TaxID=1165861 RepID=A0A0L0UR05_9BASI|nr:hypothetical protein PSTG_17186 [Puccinia striiformis f. sp. tritici PST-78]